MGKFWAKSVLCNHRTQTRKGSEFMCVYCHHSYSRCGLTVCCSVFCLFYSVNRKQSSLFFSLWLSPFICAILSFPWYLFLPLPTLPPSVSTYSISREWQAPSRLLCCRFIQVKSDMVVCPGSLNHLLLAYFLLALFLSFLFFFHGFSLESCQKLWATAMVVCGIVVVIFCCLSSSPYLARIWCVCVHEVQAP